MTGHTNNDSLTGSVTKWYNQLSQENIRSWTDLAKAFVVQYKHMTDTVLDQMPLQNMEKKASESFREYAHKWRDLAAQVQLPMTDKELNKTFLNTLKAPYYDRMVGNSNTNFSDMVSAGEMIESGTKLDKIESVEAKKPTPKKKEGETHTVSYQGKAYNPSYSRQSDRGYQSYNQYAGGNSQGNYQPNKIGRAHV